MPTPQSQSGLFVQQTVIPSFCCSGALPQNGHGLRLISGCLITTRPLDLDLELPRLGTAAVKRHAAVYLAALVTHEIAVFVDKVVDVHSPPLSAAS